jgi:hypothetical protein
MTGGFAMAFARGLAACALTGALLAAAPHPIPADDPPRRPLDPDRLRPQPLPTPRLDPRGACVVGRTCGEIRWTFEDRDGDGRGDLEGWTGEGTFFADAAGAPLQPAYGSNVSLRRVLATYPSGGPGQLRSLRSLLTIGGDYWDAPWHTGYEGSFWIGTYEARPVAGMDAETVVGDRARGAVASPEFRLDKRYVKFLAGGSCRAGVSVTLEEKVLQRACVAERERMSVVEARLGACRRRGDCVAVMREEQVARAALERCTANPTLTPVAEPRWEPTRFSHRSSDCNEVMSRASWDVQSLRTRPEPARYRIRIVDDSPFAHISADDFWITDRAQVAAPPPPPLWGFADLHTHPAAHLAYNGLLFSGTPAGETPGAWPRSPAQFWDDLGNCANSQHRCHSRRLSITCEPTDPLSGIKAAVGLCGKPDPKGDCNLHAAPSAISLFAAAARLVHPSRRQAPLRTCALSPNGLQALGSVLADLVGGPLAGPFLSPGAGTYDFGPRPFASHFMAIAPSVANRERPGESPAERDFAPGGAVPTWWNASHQMMHVNWIRRAYEGGLRVLVADAVNNRAIAWLLTANPSSVPMTDSQAIERQFDYLVALAAANSDWMEIALSPGHARRIVGEGRLALILGSEVDSFGECDNVQTVIRESAANVVVTRRCDQAVLLRRLDHFYQRGLRKMNPIHLADNALGGMAIYSPVFNASSNWLNRGDKDSLCADARVGPPFCFPAAARDPGNVYPTTHTAPAGWCGSGQTFENPGFTGDTGLTCSNDFYIRYFGYPRLRDGGANLGAQGFELQKCDGGYLTLKYNFMPFPVDGCHGYNTCQAPDMNLEVFQPGYADGRPDANAVGLTRIGRTFVDELMRRGVLIDLQHMSDLAVNEMLGLRDEGLQAIPGDGTARLNRGAASCGTLEVERLARDPVCLRFFYPAMSSHGGVRDITREGQNENSRDPGQVARIYQTGGLMGLGTSGGTRPLAVDLRRAARLALDQGAPLPAVAVGSDLNGGEAGAPPRELRWSCYLPEERPASGRSMRCDTAGCEPPEGDSPPLMVRYAGATAVTAYSQRQCGPGDQPSVSFRASDSPPLRAQVIPDYGPVDINAAGFANVGMYPDYFQDLRALGLSAAELAPLFRSAERTIQMWEKACRIATALDPASSFPAAGCLCDPGDPEKRRFCPRESPGMETRP